MEVGHDDDADGDSDYSKKFYVIIRADTVSKIVGDFLIEDDANSACGEDDETDKEGTKTE